MRFVQPFAVVARNLATAIVREIEVVALVVNAKASDLGPLGLRLRHMAWAYSPSGHTGQAVTSGLGRSLELPALLASDCDASCLSQPRLMTMRSRPDFAGTAIKRGKLAG